MDSVDGSYLPELARVEQNELSTTARVAEESRQRVTEARQRCQQQLAEVPQRLQDERRRYAEEAAKEAEEQLQALQEKASSDIARLTAVLSGQTDGLVREMAELVLPDAGELQ